jgi:Uma2 family endonuclease
MDASVAAPETTRPYTYQDLLAFPQDNVRLEIITGELILSPSPTTNHQAVCKNLSLIVWSFVRKQNIGTLLAGPIDVRINDDDVVAPDLILVSKERLGIVHDTFIAGGQIS